MIRNAPRQLTIDARYTLAATDGLLLVAHEGDGRWRLFMPDVGQWLDEHPDAYFATAGDCYWDAVCRAEEALDGAGAACEAAG